MKKIKNGVVGLLLLISGLCPEVSFAQANSYPQIRINSISQGPLVGPIHHGITVQTDGISDPNLSYYEVQLKPNSSGPFPPWRIYSTHVQPFDGATINLPYRNGIFAMQASVDYCVRLRAVYGSTVSSWAQSCGVRIPIPTGGNTDTDGDGISDAREYELGTDPRSVDTDGDGTSDGTELANGSDPDRVFYPNLIVRTTTIDFGEGDPFGHHPTQHRVLEIENQGDSPARIESIRLVDGVISGSAQAFDIDVRAQQAMPLQLSQIPPHNILRLPVSFIPKSRGRVSAQIEIVSNNPTRVPRIVVSGVGVGIPDCLITPTELDFGTVSVNDQEVLTREVTIANRPDVRAQHAAPVSANQDTDFSFTLTTTVEGMAPGLRVFTLAPGEEITIPVFFRHQTAGDYQGFLEIRSAMCGVQRVELRGHVE